MWAVIDIGSNTIRLVIYSVQDNKPHPMLNKKYAVGLAGYVDKTNRIQPDGIQVLLEALTDIVNILEYIKPKCVLPFGTAALRNSANGEEIVALIKKTCGLDVDILSGEEEATYDFYGILLDGSKNSGMLVDVGGGSTELTFFEDNTILSAVSMPIGSLNLFKSSVKGLIPTKKEAHNIKKKVKDNLQRLDNLPHNDVTTIYSVGGTARAALLLMRKYFDLGSTNVFTMPNLKELLSYIDKNVEDLAKNILRLSPDRIHTLIPGLLVLQATAKYFNSIKFITSRFGVREGYLMQHLSKAKDI